MTAVIYLLINNGNMNINNSDKHIYRNISPNYDDLKNYRKRKLKKGNTLSGLTTQSRSIIGSNQQSQ